VGGLIVFLYVVLQLEYVQQFQTPTEFAILLAGLSGIYGIIIIGLAETAKRLAGILFPT